MRKPEVTYADPAVSQLGWRVPQRFAAKAAEDPVSDPPVSSEESVQEKEAA